MKTELLTAQEVADQLGEHLATVRKHTRRGDYDQFAINLGTSQRPRWRYDARRLEQWLDARRMSEGGKR